MQRKNNEKQKEEKYSENSLTNLWDIIKQTNFHIIGDSEGADRKKRAKHLFEEIMVDNFLNLRAKKKIQIQESQGAPNKINSKTHTRIHYN